MENKFCTAIKEESNDNIIKPYSGQGQNLLLWMKILMEKTSNNQNRNSRKSRTIPHSGRNRTKNHGFEDLMDIKLII